MLYLFIDNVYDSLNLLVAWMSFAALYVKEVFADSLVITSTFESNTISLPSILFKGKRNGSKEWQ